MYLYHYATKNIRTTQNLLRSTTHGLSKVRLRNAARAIFGPPGICKWEGLVQMALNL